MSARRTNQRRRRGDVVVRGVRRSEVDIQKLSRAIAGLMAAKIEADAAAEHAAREAAKVQSASGRRAS